MLNRKFDPNQTSLFEPAKHIPLIHEYAKHGVYFGTSSWKYEGWLGQVYNDDYSGARSKFNKKKFADNSLREFATVFQSVCFDGAYYRMPEIESMEKMANAVPDGFKMSFKCTESITQRRFGDFPNLGENRNQLNPGFLDAEAFKNLFYDPITKVFENKLGSVIFEFSPFFFSKPFSMKDGYSREEFGEQLQSFLSNLPKGIRYSVEVRDPEFIEDGYDDYLNTLRKNNVAHVYNAQTWMPSIEEQIIRKGAMTSDFLLVRGLTKQGLTHSAAVKKFEPYTATLDPNPAFRVAMVDLVSMALTDHITIFIYINNRLEGNAPNTIATILDFLSTLDNPLAAQTSYAGMFASKAKIDVPESFNLFS